MLVPAVLLFHLLAGIQAPTGRGTKATPARRGPARSVLTVPKAPGRDAGRSAAKKPRPPKVLPRGAAVDLFHVNRRETLKLRLVDARGRAVRGIDKRVSQFLRCHHTNAQHRIDPRLVRLIHETGRHFPGRRLEVVSGYRHPTVARNPRSPHMKGVACDFRVQGLANTELRDFLRSRFQQVGVGYYPNSSFVHLDVRTGPSAFWIDYSGPKEDAVYSENPNLDLKSGRADSYRPTHIDPSWAESGEPAAGHSQADAPVEPAQAAAAAQGQP